MASVPMFRLKHESNGVWFTTKIFMSNEAIRREMFHYNAFQQKNCNHLDSFPDFKPARNAKRVGIKCLTGLPPTLIEERTSADGLFTIHSLKKTRHLKSQAYFVEYTVGISIGCISGFPSALPCFLSIDGVSLCLWRRLWRSTLCLISTRNATSSHFSLVNISSAGPPSTLYQAGREVLPNRCSPHHAIRLVGHKYNTFYI